MSMIEFPVTIGKVDYGKADQICFSCGADASDEMTLYFEKHRGPFFIGKIMTLLSRESITIPICQKCQSIVPHCRKMIAIWGGVFIAVVFVWITLLDLFKVSLDKEIWPLVILFVAEFVPLFVVREYWTLKDRGGAMVELVEETESSVTLKFESSEAYSRILKAHDNSGDSRLN